MIQKYHVRNIYRQLMHMRARLTEMTETYIFLLGKKHISRKLTFFWKVLSYKGNPEGSIVRSIVRSRMAVT